MSIWRNIFSAATSVFVVGAAIYLAGGAILPEMVGGLLFGGAVYLALKATIFFSQSVKEEHENVYDIVVTFSASVITTGIFLMQEISEPANELPYMALIIVLISFTIAGVFTIVFRVIEQIWPL